MKFINTRTIVVLIFFLLINGNVFSQAPVADFTVVDANGCAPHTAVFNSSLSSGNITSWSWDFGDGTGLSTDTNPSHNYATAGVYTVTLIISDGITSDTSIKTGFITVFRNPRAYYTKNADTICSGSSITFVDSSILGDAPITGWKWAYQDGIIIDSSLSTVTHVYNNSSTSLVILVPNLVVTDTNGCNSTYNNDSIFVKPFASASFEIDTPLTCSIPGRVTFSNSSTGTSLYNWNFGDPSSGANNTSTSFQPFHIFNDTGSYLITLTNGFPGCKVQDTLTLNLHPPIAKFSVNSIACRHEVLPFTNNSIPSSPAASFRWNFGDPFSGGLNTSVLTNPTHVFNTPGTFLVKLTFTVGNCSNSTIDTVTVPPLPFTSFNANIRNDCDTPLTVNFTADTTSLNVAWQWNFGDPSSASNTSNVRNPLHTFNNFGSFPVSLKVTDIFGCRDSITVQNYIQIRKPIISFIRSDSGCVGDTFSIHAIVSSPFDSIITNYTWDFGDGTLPVSDTDPDTSHIYSAPGIYNVTLSITTQTGCTATLTNTGFFRTGTKPTAIIDSVFKVICFKDEVTFHDLSPQPVTGWHWFFGQIGWEDSLTQNPTWKYEQDTSGLVNPFDIVLYVYNNGCADTDTVKDMIAVRQPIPFFSIQYNCINPDSVVFTNLSQGADSVAWNFNDGSPIDSAYNPTHIFPGSGTYPVKLTTKNFASGCIVDSTLDVKITHISAIIGGNTTACYPGTISFIGNTSQDVNIYSWTFGDGGISSASNTTHTYNDTGFYTVTLNTRDIHGCTDSATEQIHIVGPHVGFFANPLSSCVPLITDFTDTTNIEGLGIETWSWNFGDPFSGILNTSSQQNPNHHYNFPGFYTVILSVIDSNGCADMDTSVNYVSATQPTASISIPDTIGCRNVAELMIGGAGIAQPTVTYNWNFGDGSSQSVTTTQMSHTYSANGRYSITLEVVDGNNCRDTAYKNIFVFTTAANFSVTSVDHCVNDQNGIKKAIVTAIFHPDSNNYTSSTSSWQWDLGVGPLPPPVHSFNPPTYDYNAPAGSYFAKLYLTNDLGCTDTFEISSAIVVPGPSGSFSFSPDSGCSPLTVTFTGTSMNSNLYSWDFGDGRVLNGTPDSIVTHIYTSVGNRIPQFYLGFQLSTETCYIPVDTAGNVIVTSPIGVNIVETKIYVKEGERDTLTVNVTNGISPLTYNWTPLNQVIGGPTSNTFLATIDKDSAYYYVTVPYGSTGCSNFDSVLVIFVPDTCELHLLIPNVFTPDGNFQNDTYYIKNLCKYDNFRIRIFNRWGRIIYESTDTDFHWDGNTTSGTEAAEGVYYFIITAKTKQLHGYIDLIRNKK